MDDEAQELLKTNRAIQRRTEFLLKNFKAIENQDHLLEVQHQLEKKLILRFFLQPHELLSEGNQLCGMSFLRSKDCSDGQKG